MNYGQKTILTIYETNGSFGAKEELNGMTARDAMALCGYLDFYKQILINKVIGTIDEEQEL